MTAKAARGGDVSDDARAAATAGDEQVQEAEAAETAPAAPAEPKAAAKPAATRAPAARTAPKKRVRRVRVIEVIDDGDDDDDDLESVLQALDEQDAEDATTAGADDVEDESAEPEVAEEPEDSGGDAEDTGDEAQEEPAEPAPVPKPAAKTAPAKTAPAKSVKAKPAPAKPKPEADEEEEEEQDDEATAPAAPPAVKTAKTAKAAASATRRSSAASDGATTGDVPRWRTVLASSAVTTTLVVVLIGALAALAVWQWRQASALSAKDGARREVAKVAGQYGNVIYSYTPATLQSAIKEHERLMGGDLLDSYKSTEAVNLPTLFQKNPQLSMSSKIKQVFVGDVNGAFATAVILVDVQVQTAQGPLGGGTDTLFRLALNKQKGGWKITEQRLSGEGDNAASSGTLPPLTSSSPTASPSPTGTAKP